MAKVADAFHGWVAPVVNLDDTELANLQLEADAGLAPPDAVARHKDAMLKNIFGHDAVKGRDGAYLEV